MFEKLLSVVNEGRMSDIITVIDSSPDHRKYIGKMLLLHSNGHMEGELDEAAAGKIAETVRAMAWTKPVTFTVSDTAGGHYRLFWDRVESEARAIVLGGGHISQPLVQMLSMLDFNVTVIDDRPEFANPSRFPGARLVICDNFQKALAGLKIDAATSVMIVTRGHRYDLECLRATVNSKAFYLGMIGSQRRVREVLSLIEGEGVSKELLQRLRSPVGLDIKAQTPAEIAVSIVAELIMTYRGGGSGRPLSRKKGE
ncbi:XdhC family protein [Acetonema longum]|uniref:Xanthine dehydrogenase accessory factor n=1 Tax=Acetonema longum DSM 6540 TaxID=1009370 RepID=F7NED4_9FIRM|nr:XdhC family protein [Acetonema longum]EGO65646.1 xanthine dehydrogenase accessory factor [Acetonema longum DSM 6540]